jgi:8-oxo-dGTP diphosphatase
MKHKQIHVVVAVITNDSNEVFITRRHPDSHLGGLWEFPGGKVEHNETVQDALVRELQEEAGIKISQARPLIRVHHDYHDKSVLLDVWKVKQYTGEIHGCEGQDTRWVNVHALRHDELPAADVPIIKSLQLPSRYMITGNFASLYEFTAILSTAITHGIGLVQLRLKHDWVQANAQLASQVAQSAEQLCAEANISLMLNVPQSLQNEMLCNNIHADSGRLHAIEQRPECGLFSASCHTLADLHKAVQLRADFAVLSPVQKTASHPDVEALGWKKFQTMIDAINIPVYALGGVGESDIETAYQHGGQGVAAIGAFWNYDSR